MAKRRVWTPRPSANVRRKILRLARQLPGGLLTAADVAAYVRGERSTDHLTISTARGYLWRLCRDGDLERVQYGVYALKRSKTP